MNHSDFMMHVEQTDCAVPVIRLYGCLDGTNYEQLIQIARQLYNQNHRQLVLDLSELKKLSLAGMFGLHSVAAIFNDEDPLTPEAGWQALRIMKHDLNGGPHMRLKMSNPQAAVRRTLTQAGFDTYIRVYDDIWEASNAFKIEAKQAIDYPV